MAESLTVRQSQNDSGAILAARKTICFVLADAHCSDGKRFVVRADEKLTAFIELESAIRRRKAIATRHSAVREGPRSLECDESSHRFDRSKKSGKDMKKIDTPPVHQLEGQPPNPTSCPVQKKSTSSSAFFSPRVVILLLLSSATCLVVTGPLLAFLRLEGSVKASQRTLTFEERVTHQRAIEEVYWRHRIWPKENPDPKPPLDAVMSQAQVEKKVADYLRNSQVLEDYWRRPITAEQLQAEMERIAQHTKQP